MKKKGDTSFTVDSEQTGLTHMPSITRLLNRKSLLKSKFYNEAPASSKEQPSAPPSISLSPQALTPTVPPPPQPEMSVKNLSEPVLELELNRAPQQAQPQIKKAERRSTRRMDSWSLEVLRNRPQDQFAQGLLELMQPGKAQMSLYLLPQTVGSDSFLAAAALAPREKLILWTGFKWSKQEDPRLWEELTKKGFSEIPPKNIPLKQALGLNPDERLFFVRVGKPPHLRGLLIVISSSDLSPAILSFLDRLDRAVLKAA